MNRVDVNANRISPISPRETTFRNEIDRRYVMAASSTHESNSISVGVKRSISINKICYKSRVSRVSKPNHPSFSPCIQKPLYKASFSLEVLQLVGKVPFLVNTCPKRTWDAWNFSFLQLLFSAFFLSSFSRLVSLFLSFFGCATHETHPLRGNDVLPSPFPMPFFQFRVHHLSI